MISPLQKKSRIISPEELDKQIEYSRNQAISKKDCECEKVFNKNKKQHIGHLQIVLKKFEEHGIIISKSKMQLFQQTR